MAKNLLLLLLLLAAASAAREPAHYKADDDEDDRKASSRVENDDDDDRKASSRVENDDEEDDDEEDGFERLNHKIWGLSAEEAKRRFGVRQPRFATPPRQDKIDHFVVLYMENHASDNMFGCMGLPGFDGIDKGHTLPKDPTDPSKGVFNVTCGTAPYVCSGGPGYDTWAGKFPPDGSPHAYPYSPQDDKWSALHGASEGGTAVRMYSPEQIPIKAAIAKSFGVFNHLYTAVPSASSPNHLFTQSATSCGMQSNALYNDCGGPGVSFPQKTIYDSLREHNVSFGMFMNSTCGLDGKPCHGEDPITDDSPSAISTPDVSSLVSNSQIFGDAQRPSAFPPPLRPPFRPRPASPSPHALLAGCDGGGGALQGTLLLTDALL